MVVVKLESVTDKINIVIDWRIVVCDMLMGSILYFVVLKKIKRD